MYTKPLPPLLSESRCHNDSAASTSSPPRDASRPARLRCKSMSHDRITPADREIWPGRCQKRYSGGGETQRAAAGCKRTRRASDHLPDASSADSHASPPPSAAGDRSVSSAGSDADRQAAPGDGRTRTAVVVDDASTIGERSSRANDRMSSWQRDNLARTLADNAANKARVFACRTYSAQRRTVEAHAVCHLLHQRGLQQRNANDELTSACRHEASTYNHRTGQHIRWQHGDDRIDDMTHSQSTQTSQSLLNRTSVLDVAINAVISSKGLHLHWSQSFMITFTVMLYDLGQNFNLGFYSWSLLTLLVIWIYPYRNWCYRYYIIKWCTVPTMYRHWSLF